MKKVYLAVAFTLLSSSVFTGSAFSSTDTITNPDSANNMPRIYCVDAQNYWDGDFTFEISRKNEQNETFASVYKQDPEGRYLIESLPVEEKVTGTQQEYLGENFKLSIAMESSTPKQKHSASVHFQNSDVMINGEYICAFTD